MRYMRALMLMVAIGLVGCASGPAHSGYPPITGVVVNAVTGEPIEGAVVNASWVEQVGIEQSRVARHEEAVTDAGGAFRLNGYDGPSKIYYLAIYKRGYACWSADAIFNGTRISESRPERYTWQDGYTYKLQPFQQDWSYVAHESFISQSLGYSSPGRKFSEELDWEMDKVVKERDRTSRKIKK